VDVVSMSVTGGLDAHPIAGRQQILFTDLLNALSEYRAAETSMLRRTRPIMDRGATDSLALRYIEEASSAGEGLRPTELAVRLGLSSASVTTLVDRLVRRGVVAREPHPRDRRAVLLKYTEQFEYEDARALEEARRPLADVIGSLGPGELTTVIDFVNRMRDAMHEVAKAE
jgi:DNA-binding MarR family transcriptional regulator